ncbi:hypothetical protein BC826DRAFT_1092484 [Russula brevipes]|nr:hypothetical protein BC826DRAFT_1092484 [Russula brevipes]
MATQQGCKGSNGTPTTIAFDVPKDIVSRSYPGAVSDFYGLPTNPISIYRTGDEWPVQDPKGWPGMRVAREARPVFNHPLRGVWPTLHMEVYEYLDSVGVIWSTIDPVRFTEEGKMDASPLYLWIGVIPRSLSFKDAQAAAIGCKQILANAGFPDIEIAFRESLYIRSSGPRLHKLENDPSLDPIADIRYPFTPSLGIHIAAKGAPHIEGTGGLYLRENSQSERVFLLTTRHVALPSPAYSNQLYSHKEPNKCRVDIVTLGSKAYNDALEGMMDKIRGQLILITTYENDLNYFGEAVEGEGAKKTRAREVYQAKLVTAKKTIADVNDFHSDITKHWSTLSQRVLGYVLHTPPISLATGPKQFTEDWALIDLDLDNIDWDTFKGNVVYLGSKISSPHFIRKMHPHPEGQLDFEHPTDGLLRVKGVMKEAELRNPQQLDVNGENCLLVVKSGQAMGCTFGRVSGIESVIREKHGAFSAPGDSGSTVVDGEGRLVGLLTGGSGTTKTTDVTYITPYFWLEERIKKVAASVHNYIGDTGGVISFLFFLLLHVGLWD